MNSVQSILDALAKMAEKKEVISAQMYMEAASKINALLQNEVDKKSEMEYELAKVKAEYVQDGKSVAYAKTMIESIPLYLEYKKQVSLIDRAKETILIAKKNAQLSSDLIRNGLD